VGGDRDSNTYYLNTLFGYYFNFQEWKFYRTNIFNHLDLRTTMGNKSPSHESVFDDETKQLLMQQTGKKIFSYSLYLL
jgi:hypothetical protein